MMLDWKSISEGREKYAAYLCSPEWGLLRDAVERRSNGLCERGCGASGQAVHHLTYIRKYNESLDDLIHLCEPCHEFQHGRRKLDPAIAATRRSQEFSIVAPSTALADSIRWQIASFADAMIESAQSARRMAATAETVEALEIAVNMFDGCPLRRTATNTVFADGNPAGPLMIIGEGPGADEDRIGRPFVGCSGQLLDRMLATIGLDRRSVLLTNVVYWRPPGNRVPTAAEIASCLPFVLRHIALVKPTVLVLLGSTAAGALLPAGHGQGIVRLRGRWFDLAVPGLDRPVPTLPMFHPSFLLRAPERAKESGYDLLSLKDRLYSLCLS